MLLMLYFQFLKIKKWKSTLDKNVSNLLMNSSENYFKSLINNTLYKMKEVVIAIIGEVNQLIITLFLKYLHK